MTVFLERKRGITRVSSSRRELSIGGIGTTFQALSHRHGPVGPGFQGMPETCFSCFLLSKMFFEVFSGMYNWYNWGAIWSHVAVDR